MNLSICVQSTSSSIFKLSHVDHRQLSSVRALSFKHTSMTTEQLSKKAFVQSRNARRLMAALKMNHHRSVSRARQRSQQAQAMWLVWSFQGSFLVVHNNIPFHNDRNKCSDGYPNAILPPSKVIQLFHPQSSHSAHSRAAGLLDRKRAVLRRLQWLQAE